MGSSKSRVGEKRHVPAGRTPNFQPVEPAGRNRRSSLGWAPPRAACRHCSRFSVRSLRIYLQSPMQQRVLTLFSFALADHGMLFLGSSENIGDATDRFHPHNPRANLYRNRRIGVPPPLLASPTRTSTRVNAAAALQRATARITAADVPSVDDINKRIFLEATPACIVIDSRDDVIHTVGDASVAILERDGRIVHVNKHWFDTPADNAGQGMVGLAVGTNYFEAWTRANALNGDLKACLEGMRQVATGELPQFFGDYRWDLSSEQRWFRLHAVPLQLPDSGLAVAHFNITPLKRAEALLADRLS